MKHTRVQAASLSVAIAREPGSAANRTAVQVLFTEQVMSTAAAWFRRLTMQTETISASWFGCAKGSIMKSRLFNVDREPPC